MNLDKQYKMYKMMSTIRELNRAMWLFHYLIPLLHLLFIIYFMFLNIMPQISISLGVIAEVLQSIRDNYLTVHTANIYYIIGICVNVLLVVMGVLRLEFMANYDQMAAHQKLQRVLFAIAVALGYANQIGIYLFAWCFSEFYNSDGLVLAIVKSIVPLIGYIYLSGKYSNNSLYGWFTILIAILITTLNNAVSYIIVILISLYLIMEEKNLMKKVFFGFVSLVSLFVLTNSQLFKQTGSAQMQISFICLGILIILTPIFIFHIKEKLDLSNTQEKIQHCADVLNHLKADSPHSELKFQEFYELYNTVITFSLSNKDDKSAQIDPILDKQPEKLSKYDFLILLQKYLEKQCRNASESNLLKQIFLFKIKSQLEYSPYGIIKALYTLNEQVQRGNNKIYQDKIFQIFDSTIKKYGTFKNGDLESAYLIKLNYLHESFQNKVYLMLDKFENFWRQIAEQEIKLLALDACFEEVLDIESNIEQIYAEIERFGYFQRQKKIIDITRSLYNVYEQVNKYSRDVKKISDSSDKNITHSFIVLQNGLIKFISKDFMKSLGDKGSLSYENVDKKVIFGKDFSKIIDDLTKKISATSQLESVSVPVLNEFSVMQLKKVRILWYPSLEVKSRVIITFSQDVQLAHEAFLIYHIKSDTIKYFNAKFVSTFKIEQQRFLQQISNYQMFFNQLFIQTDIPAEDVKKYLLEQNTIKCHIYVKNYVERGVPHTVPVEVNVVRSIQVDGQPTHCIIKVTKSKQKKQNIMQTMQFDTNTNMQGRSFNQLNKIVASATNGNMLAKKYANEKFFCKIPNHYEGKISEKQAQLEEKNRWVCRYYIHLLFAVGFLTVLVLWIMDNKFLSTRIESYRQQLTAIENVSYQYTYMYQIYSCVVKQYYLTKYPHQSQFITNHTAQSLIAFFKKSQQSFINIVLQLFLTQFNAQPNSQIDYKIDFQEFSINTSTELTTLMDFVENAKRHVTNGEVAFLLKNYDNFRNLTVDFEASSTSQQTVINIVANSQQYFYILVVITTITLISIIIILLRIQSSIRIIYALIEQIPTKQLKQNLLAFQVRKQRIIDIFYLSNVDLFKKKAQVMNSVLTNQTLGTVTSFNSDISNNPNQMNQDLSYYLDNQYTLQETKVEREFEKQKSLGSSQVGVNKESAQTGQKTKKQTAQPVQTHRMVMQSFISKLFRKLLFIFLLLVLNGIFVLDYINLLNERDGMIQLFTIKKNFHISLLHSKRIAVDAPIRAVMEDYFNQSMPNYITPHIDLAWALPRTMILPQMQNFPQRAQQAFQQSMCKYGGPYIGSLVEIKPCNTYLGGILTKGFRETFDIFLKNAQQLSSQSLSQFGTYPCLPDKCPHYFQHEWTVIMMGQTITYMINLLDSSIEDAFTSMQTNLQVQTALKIIGLVIVMFAYYVFNKRFTTRCRKAIQYFRIIPKKIMCSMKMTTFMRKNNVLTKLEIL